MSTFSILLCNFGSYFPIISVSLSLCLRPRLVIATFLSFDNKEEHGDR